MWCSTFDLCFLGGEYIGIYISHIYNDDYGILFRVVT